MGIDTVERTRPGQLWRRIIGVLSWPRWRIALGFAAAAALATVVWELVEIGPAELVAYLRLGLLLVGFSAGVAFMVAAVCAPEITRAWQLTAAARVPRAARGSVRTLALGIVDLVLAAAIRSGSTQWWQTALWWLAAVLGLWLILVVLWPALDTTVAKLVYMGTKGGRHPTPAESARLEPLLREMVERMGLGWMPWLLVGDGFKANDDQGFGSVIVIGSERLAKDSRDQLAGLIAHELAHVKLDHGRSGAPGLLVAGAGLGASLWAVWGWAFGSVASSSLAGMAMAWLVLMGWSCLFFLAASRDNYPHEVAADACVLEHGLAREHEASLLTFDPTAQLRGLWAVWVRSHPPVEQRLARARAVLDKTPAPRYCRCCYRL